MEVKKFLFICSKHNEQVIKEGLHELVLDIFGFQKQRFKAKVLAHEFVLNDRAYAFEDGNFVGIVSIEDSADTGIQ